MLSARFPGNLENPGILTSMLSRCRHINDELAWLLAPVQRPTPIAQHRHGVPRPDRDGLIHHDLVAWTDQ